MMWSERVGSEIYVFYNGSLIYKRWLGADGQKRQPSLLVNLEWPTVWIV